MPSSSSPSATSSSQSAANQQQNQHQQQQQMRIILLGPPGSGKGTQAAVIKEKYNICYLTTEGEDGFPKQALSHRTPNTIRVEEAYRRLGYIPFELTIGMLKDTLERRPDCAKGFILEGFPRSVEQARALMHYNPTAMTSTTATTAGGGGKSSGGGSSNNKGQNNIGAAAEGASSGSSGWGGLGSLLEGIGQSSSPPSGGGGTSSSSPQAAGGGSSATSSSNHASSSSSTSSSSSSNFFHKTFGNSNTANIHVDKVISFHVTDETLMERVTGRLIHPASKRIYHETIAPPLVPGKDDVTGEPLVRKASEEEINAKREELLNYRRSFNPVRDFFRNETNIFYEIDTTNRTCGEVRRDVMAALECQNSVPPPPAPWYRRWFWS